MEKRMKLFHVVTSDSSTRSIVARMRAVGDPDVRYKSSVQLKSIPVEVAHGQAG